MFVWEKIRRWNGSERNLKWERLEFGKTYLLACRPPSGASGQIARRTQRGPQPDGRQGKRVLKVWIEFAISISVKIDKKSIFISNGVIQRGEQASGIASEGSQNNNNNSKLRQAKELFARREYKSFPRSRRGALKYFQLLFLRKYKSERRVDSACNALLPWYNCER